MSTRKDGGAAYPQEVLYFGCYRDVGHDLRSKRNPRIRWNETAWGSSIDGGCFPDGRVWGVHVAKKDGWTALAVQDNSVDTRPGSHSTFVCAADITGKELLALAKEQWPEVFGRPRFPSFVLAEDARHATEKAP